jgi:hypothetical protein
VHLKGVPRESYFGVVLVIPRVAEDRPCDSGPGRCSRRRVSEMVAKFCCLLGVIVVLVVVVVVVVVGNLGAREEWRRSGGEVK